MALNKKHDPRLEALILKAAADVLQTNPHLIAPLPRYLTQNMPKSCVIVRSLSESGMRSSASEADW